jgi:environmental stress-induced protein Ves
VERLPAHQRAVERWANGGGRTATVRRAAGWRVSIATIDDPSPFSSFPGLSRLLMPLSAAGVVLSVNGERRVLGPLGAGGFAGEDAVRARELDGPAEVLNLMWRRDRHRGTLTAVPVAGAVQLRADTAVLVAVVTAGELTVAGGGGAAGPLGRLDAVALERGQSVTVSGTGHLALARVMDRPAPDAGRDREA